MARPAPEEIVSLATHCVTPTRPYIFALCADNKIRGTIDGQFSGTVRSMRGPLTLVLTSLAVWDVQSRALLNTKEIDADKWSHEGDDSSTRTPLGSLTHTLRRTGHRRHHD